MKMFKYLNKKGFISAQDVILSVAVGALISIGLLKYQAMAAQWATYAASAHQVQDVGSAANAYVSKRFLDFVNLNNASGTSNDPGPRTCTGTTCTFTETTLVNEGFLPQGWKSDFRSGGYIGYVTRVATVPNAVIKGFIISKNEYGVGTSPILNSGIPNPNNTNNRTALYEVVQNAGVDAGYTVVGSTSTSGVAGSPWGWNYTVPMNGSITGTPDGHLIYRIGFGASKFSNATGYMLLDGSTPMQNSLNMGNNSIYGASTIHNHKLTTNQVSASTVMTVNREEDGTVYNGTSTNGLGQPMPSRLTLAGILNIGSTSITSSNNTLAASSIASKGPVSITDAVGVTAGNATLDAPVIGVASLNANTATMQQGLGYTGRTFGIESNQLTNYANTNITTPSALSILATSVHASNMTSTLEDDSSGITNISSLQGTGQVSFRNTTANTIYATNQATGQNSINAISFNAKTPGGNILLAPTACVTAGSNTKCGSNINNSTGYSTLAGGVTIYNKQLAYTTCNGTGGFNTVGLLAVDINNPNNLLSCTTMNTNLNLWVPVARGARTYTYIGKTSVSCPTQMTIVTGGASCSGGQISSAGAISGNSYTGATCAAGPVPDVVIICRY